MKKCQCPSCILNIDPGFALWRYREDVTRWHSMIFQVFTKRGWGTFFFLLVRFKSILGFGIIFCCFVALCSVLLGLFHLVWGVLLGVLGFEFRRSGWLFLVVLWIIFASCGFTEFPLRFDSFRHLKEPLTFWKLAQGVMMQSWEKDPQVVGWNAFFLHVF